MNIFFLHESPSISAKSMVDRHVVKMILESAQLLSTAHRVLDGKLEINGKRKHYKMEDSYMENALYKATHINHPSAIWVRESLNNYNWLYDHMLALFDEYTHRYNKKHKSFDRISSALSYAPKNLKIIGPTPIKCAMDEKYIISDDPVINYRNYYMNGKSHLFNWKNRSMPDFIIKGIEYDRNRKEY